MSLSVFIITALIILIMFGAGQRILDKMRMNDRWALVVLSAIIIGIIVPPISIGANFSFSIGGFVIPVAVCICLMIKAGWSKDLLRAVIGSILTAGLIVVVQVLMPASTPQDIVVDNTYIYGVVAGLVAYILGRSRRNAFICSVLGLTLASVGVFVYNLIMGVVTPLNLGVAGAFDSIIIATLISVGLAELIGETSEMIVKKENKVYNFEAGEFKNFENLEIEEVEGDKNEKN